MKSLKVNRDDVAHQRTTRIDPDTALMGFNSMLALAALIYEISEALRAPCKTTKKMTTLVQAIISLASGLGGALVGGLIAMKTSRDSIEASFRHQMTLEDVRYRQKIELEVAQRQKSRSAAPLAHEIVETITQAVANVPCVTKYA